MSRRKLTTSSATWWAFDSAELSETYHIHPVPMWQQLLPLSSFLATLINRWHITHMVSPPLPPYLEFTHRAHLAGLMMYVVPEALVRLLLLCCSYGMKHDETIHPQTAKKISDRTWHVFSSESGMRQKIIEWKSWIYNDFHVCCAVKLKMVAAAQTNGKGRSTRWNL